MGIGPLHYQQNVDCIRNMYKRPSVYYPEIKITNNLYTIGKEWMLENGTEYIGFYHKYSNGTVLTEPYYHKILSNLLIPYKDPASLPVNIYNKLKKIQPSPSVSPINFKVLPTTDDYSTGTFKRYFIYRKNYSDLNRDVCEVDEEQYKLWEKPNIGINEILYDGFTIDWKLTGPLYDVVVRDFVKEAGVYNNNRRLIKEADRIFPGMSTIITDYLEFSIYSSLTPYDIKKQFGNIQ